MQKSYPEFSVTITSAQNGNGNGIINYSVAANASLNSHNSSLNIAGKLFNIGKIIGKGIDCGKDCSKTYVKDTLVKLTATPEANSIFTHWGGACAGNTPSCQVKMSAEQDVIATFQVKSKPVARLTIELLEGTVPLTVNLNGSQSSDSDGTVDDYAWTSDDGQTAFGENAIMVFEQTGQYEITLVVTDNDGLASTNTARQTITVRGE